MAGHAHLDWFEHSKSASLPKAINKFATKKRRREEDIKMFRLAQQHNDKQAELARQMVAQMVAEMNEEEEEEIPLWKQLHLAFVHAPGSGSDDDDDDL